jgi:hypothetical protein
MAVMLLVAAYLLLQPDTHADCSTPGSASLGRYLSVEIGDFRAAVRWRGDCS